MNAIAPRSSFVTVTAMVFIVLSLGMLCVSLLQNLMLNLLVPKEAFDAMPASAPGMPAFFAFFAAHLRGFLFAFLLLSATMLAASIGLLKRKAWARIAFIALMAFGIAWNFAGLWLQHLMIQSMAAMTPPPEGGAPDFGSMMLVMRLFSVAIVLLTSALYGWIAYKLTLPRIAAEFS
jgi:hypothetical protein